MVIAFVLALLLKQIPLSDIAGMVARGEAVREETLTAEDATTLEATGSADEITLALTTAGHVTRGTEEVDRPV